ncbi:aldehyde dehydrogenase [Gorillibacterium sp. sgz500922]|uniref:aldehyde dehydrogenase n=1 Tax=Gorillibacterium sp. sgz500922 TaxID=3446694 RepID=UPI003F66125A
MNPDLLLDRQRTFFATGATLPLSFRLEQLERLRGALESHEADLFAALRDDLHKSERDSFLTETALCLTEISFIRKRLARWMKPKRVPTPLTHIGSVGRIYPEPYGSALILAPWNYPVQLAIAPLIGAIAAGNCAVVKPSELTPRVSAVLARLIGDTFPADYIAVVEGGVDASEALLAQPFDYLFFTGSPAVGRIVMEKAARHLTPVTLELGGKSPVIVHRDADLAKAARRIAWAKTLNAGQTCVAPDYLYVHEEVKKPLLAALREQANAFYGSDPLRHPDLTRIVNERHFRRLVSYLDEGRVVFGGGYDEATRAMELTVLEAMDADSAVMQDEIFGPILPVLTYRDLNEALAGIRSRPKPLSLYLFTESREMARRVLRETSFGGGAVNDAVYHLASPYLPFGGVGTSGTGSYHGRASFDTFTHYKSVLHQTSRFDLPFRYPDSKAGLGLLRKLMK